MFLDIIIQQPICPEFICLIRAKDEDSGEHQEKRPYPCLHDSASWIISGPLVFSQHWWECCSLVLWPLDLQPCADSLTSIGRDTHSQIWLSWPSIKMVPILSPGNIVYLECRFRKHGLLSFCVLSCVTRDKLLLQASVFSSAKWIMLPTPKDNLLEKLNISNYGMQ